MSSAVPASRSAAKESAGGRPLPAWVFPTAFVAILIVAWELIQRATGFPEYLVPLPSSVAKLMVKEAPLLLDNVWVTLLEALGGFVIGNSIAMFLAVLFVYNKTIERAVYPLAITLKSVPIVAITPILVLLLGTGWAPKIAIAAIISFFPTLVNMVRGLQAVEPNIFELTHVLNASTLQVFLKVRLPSSLPYLFSALRISVTSSILGAVVAEWIGSNQGIGYLIIISTYQFRSDLLYTCMVLASSIAIFAFFVMGLVERWLAPWAKDTDTGA